LDSGFNPLNDAQAVARAHRLGQTRTVTVYRPFVAGTYEETLFQKADRKLGAAMVFRMSNAAAAPAEDALDSLFELRAANLDTAEGSTDGPQQGGPDVLAFISQGFWRSMREDAGLASLPEVAAMITAVSGSAFDAGQLSSEQQTVIAAAMKRLADVRAGAAATSGGDDDAMMSGVSKTRSGGIRVRIHASQTEPGDEFSTRHQPGEVVNEDALPASAVDDLAVDVGVEEDEGTEAGLASPTDDA
jgi:hypothetical protein